VSFKDYSDLALLPNADGTYQVAVTSQEQNRWSRLRPTIGHAGRGLSRSRAILAYRLVNDLQK
jgi:hypothetical protein